MLRSCALFMTATRKTETCCLRTSFQVFLKHFVEQSGQTGRARMARLCFDDAGLGEFVGQVQRCQHGHAQRVHGSAVAGHGAHLGVNTGGQLADVVGVLAGEVLELIVDLNRHVAVRVHLLFIGHGSLLPGAAG